jgi:hypothetical protein
MQPIGFANFLSGFIRTLKNRRGWPVRKIALKVAQTIIFPSKSYFAPLFPISVIIGSLSTNKSKNITGNSADDIHLIDLQLIKQ